MNNAQQEWMARTTKNCEAGQALQSFVFDKELEQYVIRIEMEVMHGAILPRPIPFGLFAEIINERNTTKSRLVVRWAETFDVRMSQLAWDGEYANVTITKQIFDPTTVPYPTLNPFSKDQINYIDESHRELVRYDGTFNAEITQIKKVTGQCATEEIQTSVIAKTPEGDTTETTTITGGVQSRSVTTTRTNDTVGIPDEFLTGAITETQTSELSPCGGTVSEAITGGHVHGPFTEYKFSEQLGNFVRVTKTLVHNAVAPSIVEDGNKLTVIESRIAGPDHFLKIESEFDFSEFTGGGGTGFNISWPVIIDINLPDELTDYEILEAGADDGANRIYQPGVIWSSNRRWGMAAGTLTRSYVKADGVEQIMQDAADTVLGGVISNYAVGVAYANPLPAHVGISHYEFPHMFGTTPTLSFNPPFGYIVDYKTVGALGGTLPEGTFTVHASVSEWAYGYKIVDVITVTL